MLQKCRNTVERYLRARGFTSPESRRIVTDQVLLTVVAGILGLLLSPLTNWGMAFAFGTLLATVNLWQIARFAHWSVKRQFSGKLAIISFLAFLFRFAGTGFVLYVLLIQAAMPAIPLIVGLSSLVVWLSVMHFSRNAGHSW